MSYAAAALLQSAIYEVLTRSPELQGVPIFDAIPLGGISGTFILIGPEDAYDASDKTSDGATHDFTISVISDALGFLPAKTIAAKVSQILVGQTPSIPSGQINWIEFVKAKARRLDDGSARKVDMILRARVDL